MEALNTWNELYNKPKLYQHDPGNYPKEGPTVAQGYYTQANDKEDDSDESNPDLWDGSYFSPNVYDDYYGDYEPF